MTAMSALPGQARDITPGPGQPSDATDATPASVGVGEQHTGRDA